jgi:Cytochrome c oxidase subunit IV
MICCATNVGDTHKIFEFQALREKEKGDWKKMSVQEKKALYRASFCQTFSEMKYPTGEWKMHIGAALIAASLAIYVSLLMSLFGKFRIRESSIMQLITFPTHCSLQRRPNFLRRSSPEGSIETYA